MSKGNVNKQFKRENRERKERQHFTEPLTGKQARHIAGSMAGQKWNPTIRSEAAEKRGSVKRQKQLGSAYAGLTAEIGANAQKASEGNAATNAAITQRLQQAGLQSQSSLNNLAAGDSATAKLLGGPSNAAGTAQMAAGNSQRASQLVALTAPNTAAGASYANYLRQRGTSSRERGIEATSGEAARRAKIKEDMRVSKKERGSDRNVYLNELRKAERDYKIQNRAFPLEKQKAGLEASEAAEENRRKNQKLRNENTKTRNEGTKIRNEEKGGNFSPSEKHSKKAKWNNAKASAKTLFERGRGRKTPKGETIYTHKNPKGEIVTNKWNSWAELIAEVANEAEVSPAMAKRAVERIRKHEERNRGPSGGNIAGIPTTF